MNRFVASSAETLRYPFREKYRWGGQELLYIDRHKMQRTVQLLLSIKWADTSHFIVSYKFSKHPKLNILPHSDYNILDN